MRPLSVVPLPGGNVCEVVLTPGPTTHLSFVRLHCADLKSRIELRQDKIFLWPIIQPEITSSIREGGPTR